ncbi:MAG: O-antigen ligase domain-containing protein [Alphaproteobacteria bacterium]|nr:O-antigen ligase domain-containing protein [Alphaproteobacteria bacterium]MBU1561629.1 O-antigen ligase domain-containing protein [Alphaproteobacteria bacterium]MBU2302390.1 O-antigen ligase domain-containing protein [Alphaproteobacteria bacterium]MBU2368670.1 O-antigen ligase domain-containing protein [Alphaproteobacteria bacterium]
MNVLVPVFLTALFVPWLFNVGGMVISPYRFLLILTVVPCLWLWASGKAGPVRVPDFAVLGYAMWCAIGLGANHGADVGFQSGGVQGVETVGSYFLARVLIRDADDFRRMCTVLVTAVMILLPFALIETVTGQNYLLRGFTALMPSITEYRMLGRLGLERAQSVLDHPILFGVCTGSALALSFSVMGYGALRWRRWGTACLVVLTSFTSLSAGPMSAIAAQVLLLLWGWLLRPFKARWTLLLWLIGFALLFIELFAKRPLPNVLLSSFALDAESAYYRVLIWNFGSQSALNHPVFGVGYGMWDHPSWMTQSIDMFWLYPAIVFGLPASFLMFTAFLGSAISVGRKRYLSPRDYSFRMGYLICLAGFFVVGWTVHFWNATYVLFMFLMASGMWLLDVPEHKSHEEHGPAVGRTARLSALPVRHVATRERPKVSARRPAHGG